MQHSGEKNDVESENKLIHKYGYHNDYIMSTLCSMCNYIFIQDKASSLRTWKRKTPPMTALGWVLVAVLLMMSSYEWPGHRMCRVIVPSLYLVLEVIDVHWGHAWMLVQGSATTYQAILDIYNM